jgi:hypothetical protein
MISVEILSEEEFPSLKEGTSFLKSDCFLEEIENIGICFDLLPLKPADLVVLTIGIVVALLCPHEFIAAESI